MMRETTPAKVMLSARGASGRGGAWVWCALALALATGAAYWNSFSGVFVFGDEPAIVSNESIRQLWPLGPVLQPPGGTTVSGRPLLNVTFALNHAISGDAAWSYHATNFLIHVLAGLTLFGLIRRTLRQPVLAARFGDAATGIAFVATALWLLHPLQTGAVTYVAQRAESLAGLCYLVVMYGFVRATGDRSPLREDAERCAETGSGVCTTGLRGALNHGRDPRGTTGWLALSVAACFAGMATKEILVTAPVVMLFYDRTFLAGSFREALRRRQNYYGALVASWVLLAGLMWGLPGHGESVGFTSELWTGDYLVTQAYAIALYLKLAFWPAPLVFDYGPEFVVSLTDVWMQALVVVGVLAASTEAVMRRAPIGFASVWFFGVLAPTSSIVPIAAQTIAEHRMYLPLAAVIVAVVVSGYRFAGRTGLVGGAVLALVLGWSTHQRNAVFQSDLALWSDTLEHRPKNARALHGLGVVHSKRGEHQKASALLEEALRLSPQLRFVAKPAVVHTTVGHHLAALGRPTEAISHYQQALEIDSYYAPGHHYLALALMQLDRPAIAIRHFREALRLNIGGTGTHVGLAEAFLARDQVDDAMEQFREALRLDPGLASVHQKLGEALRRAGRSAEAEEQIAIAKQLEAGK